MKHVLEYFYNGFEQPCHAVKTELPDGKYVMSMGVSWEQAKERQIAKLKLVSKLVSRPIPDKEEVEI